MKADQNNTLKIDNSGFTELQSQFDFKNLKKISAILKIEFVLEFIFCFLLPTHQKGSE